MPDPMQSADDDMDDREFWRAASSFSMARISGNPEDDVYAELLYDSAVEGEQSASPEAPKDRVSSPKKGAGSDQGAER